MAEPVARASVSIAACSYFLSLIGVFILCYQELYKRKDLKLLSWNGNSKSPNSKTQRTQSPTSSDNRRTHSSTTGSGDSNYIAGSMHYLSIGIYICAVISCIGGIIRAIPDQCSPLMIMPHILAHGTAKTFILAFQLQRYYMCFVKDFINTSSVSSKSRLNIFVTLFYVCAIVGLIAIAASYIVMSTTALNDDNLYSWNGIWCTFATTDLKTRFNLIIQGSLYMICDWLVLLLFFMTIRSISIKLERISLYGQMSNVASQSASMAKSSSLNSTGSTEDIIVRQDSNYNARARATVIAIEKLKWILTRIFVCSVAMEITYFIAAVVSALTPVGSLIWSLSYVFYAIDNVVNVAMINLMLQHNKDDYTRFIKLVSKVCCCISGYITYQQDFHSMKNECMNKTQTTRKTAQTAEKKKAQTSSNNASRKGSVAEFDDNHHYRGDTMQTVDTEIAASRVNQDKRVSGLTVDRSYYNSEMSKDETIIPDAL